MRRSMSAKNKAADQDILALGLYGLKLEEFRRLVQDIEKMDDVDPSKLQAARVILDRHDLYEGYMQEIFRIKEDNDPKSEGIRSLSKHLGSFEEASDHLARFQSSFDDISEWEKTSLAEIDAILEPIRKTLLHVP